GASGAWAPGVGSLRGAARAAAETAHAAPAGPFVRAAPPSLSCVIPSLNEAANLVRLLPLLCDALARQVAQWEVIVVDDGSRDGTVQALRGWWQSPRGVRVLQLARNFGKEAALSAGLQA